MDELIINLLKEKGFQSEFAMTLVTEYLQGDYAKTRMLGYLYRYSNPSIEEVVDEMIAIQSDLEDIRRQKSMEATQAKLNDIYRNGLGVEEE